MIYLSLLNLVLLSPLWTATAFPPQQHHHHRHPNARRSPSLPLEASSVKLSDQDVDVDVDVDVVIIGGGLVGMATAVALAHRGGISNIQILEKASSLRPIGAAIGLYPNGLAALEYISPQVATQVQETCIPSRYFVRRDLNETLVRETDVRNIQATSPVMLVWYQLQRLLYEALPPSEGGGVLHLGCTLDSCQVLESDASNGEENSSSRVQLCISRRSPDGEVVKETKTCKVLIGADGIQSTVRNQFFGKRQLYYHGKIMYRSVLDLGMLHAGTCPPPGTQLSFQGDELGKSFSIRETSPGIVTVTAAALCCDEHLLKTILESNNNNNPKDDTISPEKLNSLKKKRFQDLFSDYPAPTVQHVLDRLDATAIHEDAIRDIEVEPRWSQGPVTLIGDAAHAMTPHMGQGANQGLEDVCHLVQELAPVLLATTTGSSISEALTRFWKSRIERVQEIHQQSRQNSVQSNTFDKESAATPFERRKYSESFQNRLYNWKPPPPMD
jgi:2-polyprenyl-6-methoxyphenol hydroxylase-like FAD-dependent oxidoreductase